MEVMHGFNNTWTSTHRRLTWLHLQWHVRSTSIRDQQWALICYHFPGGPASNLLAGWPLLPWEGQRFVFTGVYTHSVLDFLFLHEMLVLKHHLWAYRILYLPSWYSTKSCFWSKNLFIVIEVQQQAHIYAVHWLYRVSHHLDVTGLTERCLLLEDTVTATIRWRYSGGLWQVSL